MHFMPSSPCCMPMFRGLMSSCRCFTSIALSSHSLLENWAATSYKSSSEGSFDPGHVSLDFVCGSVDKGTAIWYNSPSDGSNPCMYVDLKLKFGKEEGLFTWKASSEVSLKFTCLGNSVGVLCENVWQGKVLHMVETNEHLSGSRFMLAVFRQLFNGHGSTLIAELLALFKASAIGMKENKWFSSLMFGSFGCHILYWTRFEFTRISTHISTFVMGVLLTDSTKVLKMLMNSYY